MKNTLPWTSTALTVFSAPVWIPLLALASVGAGMLVLWIMLTRDAPKHYDYGG